MCIYLNNHLFIRYRLNFWHQKYLLENFHFKAVDSEIGFPAAFVIVMLEPEWKTIGCSNVHFQFRPITDLLTLGLQRWYSTTIALYVGFMRAIVFMVRFFQCYFIVTH